MCRVPTEIHVVSLNPHITEVFPRVSDLPKVTKLIMGRVRM